MAFGPLAGAGRGFASAASRRAFFARKAAGGAERSAGSKLAQGRARRAGERKLGRERAKSERERNGRGREGRGRGGRGGGGGGDEFWEEDVKQSGAEDGVSEAAEEALASAGNAGQESILERCIDSWIDYAVNQIANDMEIEEEEIKAMCSHPEAVSEIIQDFISNCQEYSGEIIEVELDG